MELLNRSRQKSAIKGTVSQYHFKEPQEPVGEPVLLETDGKPTDTRHPKPGTRPKGGESKRSADKSRGMPVLRSRLATEGGSRTYKYAAVTRDEDNAVDRGFPTASSAKNPIKHMTQGVKQTGESFPID